MEPRRSHLYFPNHSSHPPHAYRQINHLIPMRNPSYPNQYPFENYYPANYPNPYYTGYIPHQHTQCHYNPPLPTQHSYSPYHCASEITRRRSQPYQTRPNANCNTSINTNTNRHCNVKTTTQTGTPILPKGIFLAFTHSSASKAPLSVNRPFISSSLLLKCTLLSV